MAPIRTATTIEPGAVPGSVAAGLRGRLGRGLLAVLLVASIWPRAASADTASGLGDFEAGRYGEAYVAWREAARDGDATAALYLGVLYDVGQGVPADPAQALEWYGVAARLGSVPAMFNLGVLHDGAVALRDPALAVRYYRQAAEAGFGRAQFNLGLIYESGDGVPRDPAEARRWFGRAYRSGISAASLHLGGSRDALPRRAALVAPVDPGMRAFEQAQTILLNRDPATLHQAVTLFRASAEADNPLAAYDLAYCYEHAIGTPQNLAEAYRWYGRAAARATDEELRRLAGRNAAVIAANLPELSRGMQAQASH